MVVIDSVFVGVFWVCLCKGERLVQGSQVDGPQTHVVVNDLVMSVVTFMGCCFVVGCLVMCFVNVSAGDRGVVVMGSFDGSVFMARVVSRVGGSECDD